jgi:hypothetical protein
MVVQLRAHAVAVAMTLLPSVAIAVVALVTASGVTRLDEYNYRTEFVHEGWWMLAWVLPVLVGVATWWWPRAALLAGTCALAPQFLVGLVVVWRYRAFGWSDGLEIFVFLYPSLLAVLCAAVYGLAEWLRSVRSRPNGVTNRAGR